MEARRCEGGRGVDWIRDGWRAFAASPGMWILLCIVFALVLVALQWISWIGPLISQLIAPALSGGLLIAARNALTGDGLEIGQLFAPLTDERTRNPVLVLGVLFLVANLVVLAAVALIVLGGGMAPAMHATAMQGGRAGAEMMTQLGPEMLLVALVGVALWMLVFLLFYYAIPLVLFAGVGPVAALGLSVRGILRNIVPLLVLSVIWLVLSAIASLLLFLGWLVLVPMTYGAWYASYRDVFPEPGGVPPLADPVDT